MTFERTTNLDLVRMIMRHPKIYPHISDDFAPPAEEFEPVAHEGIWYVLVKAGAEPVGVFVFVPQNGICWEVHTCLLPTAWGAVGKCVAKGVARWIFEHTPCQRVVTSVPEYNRVALHFARAAGMTEYGRNPQSYMKNGVTHDQILLGLSCDEETPWPQH